LSTKATTTHSTITKRRSHCIQPFSAHGEKDISLAWHMVYPASQVHPIVSFKIPLEVSNLKESHAKYKRDHARTLSMIFLHQAGPERDALVDAGAHYHRPML